MRRARVCALLAIVVVTFGVAAVPAGAAEPEWAQGIDDIIGGRPFSVVVGKDGETWYRHLDWVRRPPASNEKLLLSMTLLARYGPARTIRTEVKSDGPIRDGVLHGNLWLVGHGDPETVPGSLKTLAGQVRETGIARITGRVIGGIGPFGRDWWAPGWRDYFPSVYIPLPTALTFRGNEDSRGVHVRDPERRAALALTSRLEGAGVKVRKPPDARPLPGGLTPVSTIRSASLADMLRRMNVRSRNFWAEVLTKHVGFDSTGAGTMAAGAAAVRAFAARHGVQIRAHDGSGLSYDNRVTAAGIVRLLWHAGSTHWGDELRASLPMAGQGTLEDRLIGVRLRAKTGTLIDASALSGWVWTQNAGRIEFSILSNHFDDHAAKAIEDRIVRLLEAEAFDPTPRMIHEQAG